MKQILGKKSLKSNKTLFFFFLILLFLFNGIGRAQQKKVYEIESPDTSIKMIITLDEYITFSVRVDGKTLISSSRISMKLNDRVLGFQPKVSSISKRSEDENIVPVVAEKFKVIRDHFNELKISLKKKYAVTFRIYNNGVAYRFSTRINKPIEVIGEEATFNINKGTHVYLFIIPKKKVFSRIMKENTCTCNWIRFRPDGLPVCPFLLKQTDLKF